MVNWKILNSPQHFIAIILNTWISNAVLQFILLLLLLNSNKYSKILVSDNKVVFNNCEKYLVLLAGKMFVELHVFIFIHKGSQKLTPYLFQNYAALFF